MVLQPCTTSTIFPTKLADLCPGPILIPNQPFSAQAVVPYDDDKKDGDRYFVVGCFGSAGYSAFSAKGK